MTGPPTIEGFQSEFVRVDGTQLHYHLGGDPNGQPVLLWHGFLSSGYAWRKIAPALAAAGLSVLVPDMRGYGDSDKPAGTVGYDARELAEEARGIVAELGFGAGKTIIHASQDMGSLPALIWAADHPEEVKAIVYIEAPVMLGEVLRKIVAFTPETMAKGSMWWWILPMAPGIPERLIIGNERAFLDWFYETATDNTRAIEPETADEYLRTLSGREGVLGSLGIYRAAFTSIAQTEPLRKNKVQVPIIAIGGKRGLGRQVGEMVSLVAENVTAYTFADCGHFLIEECPEAVIERILTLAKRQQGDDSYARRHD